MSRDESIIRVHLLPTLGKTRIGAIVSSDVRKLVSKWSERLAPRTVKRTYGVLHAIMQFAVDDDIIAVSPCRGIKLPQIEPVTRHVLTVDELERLAVTLGPRWSAMVYLGAVLGLRWGECAGLRLGAIDFDRNEVRIVEQVTRGKFGQTVTGPPKSSAGRRTMTLPDGLVDLLKAHVLARVISGPEALLFPKLDGDPVNYANWRRNVWIPSVKRAGLDALNSGDRRNGLEFHDLRRANATALVREGVDLKTAQTRLGHSDVRLTLEVYAQATTEADRSAAGRLDDHFFGRPRDKRAIEAAADDSTDQDTHSDRH